MGHPQFLIDNRRLHSPRPSHPSEMEARAHPRMGAPSFALSTKGGNVSPVAQSKIRLKLLEILLTPPKSATSLFLIDNFCRYFRSRSTHLPEMEALVLSHVPAPSSAPSAKGGNASPLPQSKIRLKLLEILLTPPKSATSLFLIDNFLPHFQFAFASNPHIFPPFLFAKESTAHD